MTDRDCVVLTGYLVRCPLGGYAWQILHYLVGLRLLGLDPYFYEDTAFCADCFDPTTGAMHGDPGAGVTFVTDFFARFGFADHWAFWDAQRNRHHGLAADATAALLHDARLVITLAPVNRLPRVPGQRRLFIDIDPAFTQTRAAHGDTELTALLAEHDRHFSIGENIGTPFCPIPAAGFDWRPTRQPIAAELWTPAPPNLHAPFTTIGRWDEQRRDVTFRGIVYSWSKRPEWMRFLDLPQRSGERFQIAVDVDRFPADADLLRENGWDILDPTAVSRDAFAYQDFIRHSKGEFTVAKDLNIRLSSGWFSDRAACYLAAARPVVTQDTGFGRQLPTGAGLFAVASVDEAARAIRQVSANYGAHCDAARRIATEYFDARRILGGLLEDS